MARARCSYVSRIWAFVYCSSSSVNHDNFSDLIEAYESLPILRPPVQKRVYTWTKAVAEEDVIAANRTAGMLTVSTRPCTTFSPGDDIFSSRVVEAVQTGRAEFQLGEGKNAYDFDYVDNLVHSFLLATSALIRVADKPPPSDECVEGEPFNITNGEHIPFWGFTLAMAAAWGTPVLEAEIVKIALWIGLIMGLFSEWAVWIFSLGRKESNMSVETVKYIYKIRTLSIQKARPVLGFKPPVSLHDGIKTTDEWFKEHNKRQQKTYSANHAAFERTTGERGMADGIFPKL